MARAHNDATVCEFIKGWFRLPKRPFFLAPGLAGRPNRRQPVASLNGRVRCLADRLYFTSTAHPPQSTTEMIYFTIDNMLHYIPFFSDFGPMNIAHIYRFCHILQAKVEATLSQRKRICLYSSMEMGKRANAAYLMCAYMLIVHGKSPEEAHQPLHGASPPIPPYRDAGYGPATFFITILDCLRGIHKAIWMGLINFSEFNLEEYEHFEKVENGDLNWITKKFIAFASPQDELHPLMMGRSAALAARFGDTFEKVVRYFKEHEVTVVIRLNNKLYDRQKFVNAGIDHQEMYFPDGSCPSDQILHRFLGIADSQPGVIAVHCKAGLGRTGTLIGAWLMKEYKFTAAEVIAFLRVLRPGSVVGPQQNYMQMMQPRLWKMESTCGIQAPSQNDLLSTHLLRNSKSSSSHSVDLESSMLINEIPKAKEFVIPAQPRKSLEERAAQMRYPMGITAWQSPTRASTSARAGLARSRYSLRSETNAFNGAAQLAVNGSSLVSAASTASLEDGHATSTGTYHAILSSDRQVGLERLQATRPARKPRTTAASYGGYLLGGTVAAIQPAVAAADAAPPATSRHHQEEKKRIEKPKHQTVKMRYH